MIHKQGDIGVIGLAVMGQNLALNINNNGFNVIVFNRTLSTIKNFINSIPKKTNITAVYSIEDLVGKLKSPRKIILMVKSGGDIVDTLIKKLTPLLVQGDIIIDGGNTNFIDTERRVNELKNQGIYYIGAGISGGKEGARLGPSIMPGGMIEGWKYIKPIFQKISAKTTENTPCCEWIGQGGSGHFVKMVHNGMEYSDMQLICEVYQFMKDLLGMDNKTLSHIFETWNKSSLQSYLIEITAKILQFKDDEGYVIDRIADIANQKGTGKWTGINALNLDVPLNLVTESVFSRFISRQKEMRLEGNNLYNRKKITKIKVTESLLHELQQGYLFAKIISYAQGYMLMQQASQKYNWSLNYSSITSIWREGCIIKSVLLDNIKTAFDSNPCLKNLLFDPYFKNIIDETLPATCRIIIKCIKNGMATPNLSAALNFFNSITTKKLPANLLQAQRDYFGSHTYERTDQPEGVFFHTNWKNNEQ